jgi:RHS repeat-associated protein
MPATVVTMTSGTVTKQRSHAQAGVPHWRSSSPQGSRSARRDCAQDRSGPFHAPTCAIPEMGAGSYGSYVDEPLMMKAGGSKYYFATNHLYSVAALTDSTGAVVERYKYDAYGRQGIMNQNGTVSYNPSDYGNFVGFTGRYHDWETGLVYFRTRYMDTTLGRFLNRQPWFGMNGLNIPAYNLNCMPDNWRNTMMSLMKSASGSYLQDRMNLYDFNKDDPANRLEPFSGTTVSIPNAPGVTAYVEPNLPGGMAEISILRNGVEIERYHFSDGQWQQMQTHGGPSVEGGLPARTQAVVDDWTSNTMNQIHSYKNSNCTKGQLNKSMRGFAGFGLGILGIIDFLLSPPPDLSPASPPSPPGPAPAGYNWVLWDSGWHLVSTSAPQDG